MISPSNSSLNTTMLRCEQICPHHHRADIKVAEHSDNNTWYLVNE